MDYTATACRDTKHVSELLHHSLLGPSAGAADECILGETCTWNLLSNMHRACPMLIVVLSRWAY